MKFILLLIILLSETLSTYAAATVSATDRQVLKDFWEYAGNNHLSALTPQKRVPLIAGFFLGSPYKSNTLNVTKKELPVINLHELDCVTFIENVLALTFLDEYSEKATDKFIENIVRLRYRNGEIEDYTSRLHYSTDWLYEMQRICLLTDITYSIGGIIYPHKIDFMTRNYIQYPVLNQDKKLIPKMKTIETEINKRTYHYIPKGRINEFADKIETGDIVLITTSIKGLDTSHLGFAIKQGANIYLIHASSKGKKVMITDTTLQEYMGSISSQSGIIIARLTDKV